MNYISINSIIPIIVFSILGFIISTNIFAFAPDENTQVPSESVPESCYTDIMTIADVTKHQLESGTTNNRYIFGSVITSCNSADGFKYQIKADGDTCEFKHYSLDNSAAYSINVNTPAVFDGNAAGSVVALSDGCPDNSSGYVDVWIVPAGSVHVDARLSLQVNIYGAGNRQLPDGVYYEAMSIRIVDL